MNIEHCVATTIAPNTFNLLPPSPHSSSMPNAAREINEWETCYLLPSLQHYFWLVTFSLAANIDARPPTRALIKDTNRANFATDSSEFSCSWTLWSTFVSPNYPLPWPLCRRMYLPATGRGCSLTISIYFCTCNKCIYPSNRCMMMNK